jgi:SAM-dependent methyltransferase
MTELPSFDLIWENKYSSGHIERYPWDVVVSFIFNNYPKNKLRSQIHILEVGCGTGSNLWFAAREGFSVAGIDGSVSAISKAHALLGKDGLSGDLRVGDFTTLPFADEHFDLVIDRGSLTCCSFEMGKKAIAEIRRVTNKNGRFFFNPYSKKCTSFHAGDHEFDGLVTNIQKGSMIGVGQICFYDQENVLSALSGFDVRSLQHMECIEILGSEQNIHAEWRVIAEKF